MKGDVRVKGGGRKSVGRIAFVSASGWMLLFFLLSGVSLSAQWRADSALVQMARAEVSFYDIPQVESLEQPGIVRSRYNTVYPVSWILKDGALTNGEALVSLFVVRLQGREQKLQTIDTFHDETAHRGICQGYGARHLHSEYFRTAAGKNALRIGMYRRTSRGGEYLCVYFVLLNSGTLVSGTAVAPAGLLAPGEDLPGESAAGKYRVLFDAIVKNIDRR